MAVLEIKQNVFLRFQLKELSLRAWGYSYKKSTSYNRSFSGYLWLDYWTNKNNNTNHQKNRISEGEYSCIHSSINKQS